MKGNPYYRAYQFFSSEMGLSGAEKDVFGVIYNAVANMKGVVSIRQIEMRAGRRRATVCKALNALISKGYIIKVSQTAEGKNTFALGKARVGKTICFMTWKGISVGIMQIGEMIQENISQPA